MIGISHSSHIPTNTSYRSIFRSTAKSSPPFASRSPICRILFSSVAPVSLSMSQGPGPEQPSLNDCFELPDYIAFIECELLCHHLDLLSSRLRSDTPSWRIRTSNVSGCNRYVVVSRSDCLAKRPSADRALPSIARLRAVSACASIENRAALEAGCSCPLVFCSEGSLADHARALVDRASAPLALRVPALSPVSLVLRPLPRVATLKRAGSRISAGSLRLVLERTVAVKAFEVNPHPPPAPSLGGGCPRAIDSGADFAPRSVGPISPLGGVRSRASFAPISGRNRPQNFVFWLLYRAPITSLSLTAVAEKLELVTQREDDMLGSFIRIDFFPLVGGFL